MTCRLQFLTDNLVLQYRATLVGGESSSVDYGVLKMTETSSLHNIIFLKCYKKYDLLSDQLIIKELIYFPGVHTSFFTIRKTKLFY